MFISKNITTHQTNKNAFTLIELLVVIVIIGVLATLTTVSLTSARGKARDARRISDLKQIATALELYQADNNSYPTYITGGNALASADGSKVYMKKIPSDPSTNASYAYYGSTSRFTLRTTIEKSVDNIPVGPVIITSGGGVKQAVNSDNRFMDPDLSFGALVGHWVLDGSAGTRDLSGLINGSLIVGVPANLVTSTGRFGELDGSYNFDGSNDYVDISSGDSLDLAIEFSLGFWSKGTGDVAGAKPYEKARIFIAATQIGITSSVPGEWTYCYKNHGVDPSVAYHNYVFTFKNGTATWYVDGVSLDTCAISAGFVFKLDYIADSYNWTNSYSGNITDFRVYNKELVSDQISALYYATKP